MNPPIETSAARERILKTASELFYRKGYRATGINELIKKSGVAKATFYAHFPSKDDLALAYVQEMSRREIQSTKEELNRIEGAYEKLIGLLEGLEPWAKKHDYRGCGYLNLCGEIPDAASPVRREGKLHYEMMRAIIRHLVNALKRRRGAAWKDRNPVKVTDDYMLIFSGALAMAELYHDPAPLRAAVDAARRLLA